MTGTNKWWLKNEIKCNCCETTFRISEDAVVMAAYDRMNNEIFIPVNCPVCILPMKLYKELYNK